MVQHALATVVPIDVAQECVTRNAFSNFMTTCGVVGDRGLAETLMRGARGPEYRQLVHAPVEIADGEGGILPERLAPVPDLPVADTQVRSFEYWFQVTRVVPAPAPT